MEDGPNENTALPPGWVLSTVKDVGAIRLGRQRSPEKHTGVFPTPYLRAANIKNGVLDLSDVLKMDFTPQEQAIFGLARGDVVLAEASGSATQVGRAAIWQEEIPNCCYQNTVIRFRPHAVASDYALLVFRQFSVAGTFARVARGVGIQHLGAARFGEMPFPLPPMKEQRRIALEVQRRLSELSSARASLDSALRRTHEQQREILAAAADGALAGQSAVGEANNIDVASTGTTKINAGPQAILFGDTGKLTKLSDSYPDLPDGWIWATIGSVGDARLGKQLSPAEERGPQKRPYLRVANVFEDRLDLSDVKSMHFSDEEFANYKLEAGDILLNEGQSPELVGRPAMYRGEVPGVCFQNTLIRFRASSVVDRDYALLVFRHYLHSGDFQRRAQWSTNIAHLGLQRFAAMPFPLPPLSVQRLIAAEAAVRLQACAAQASAIMASLARLPAMEVEILDAAVRGKLVAQDPSDESAAALLHRLGPPPGDHTTLDTLSKRSRREKPVKNTRRTSQKDMAPKLPLPAVLRQAEGSLSLPDLFSRAGYDRDSTEDVEQFYLALRDALGRTIRQTNDAGENTNVEVIDNASR